MRNLYGAQEATVRTEYEITDSFKIGKGVQEGYTLSPCLFNFYAEYIMEMLVWMIDKLESSLLTEISATLDMQMIPL